MEKKPKHCWSYEEDKYICDLYRDMFIVKTDKYYFFNDLFEKVLRRFPYLNPISVDRRIANVKAICNILKIKDKLNKSELAHYALQTLQAFKDSLQEINFDIKKKINNETKTFSSFENNLTFTTPHTTIEDFKEQDVVNSFSIVTIEYLDDNEILTVTGHKDNATTNITFLDINSPLMQALLNKKQEDIVNINTSHNSPLQIKILNIKNN